MECIWIKADTCVFFSLRKVYYVATSEMQILLSSTNLYRLPGQVFYRPKSWSEDVSRFEQYSLGFRCLSQGFDNQFSGQKLRKILIKANVYFCRNSWIVWALPLLVLVLHCCWLWRHWTFNRTEFPFSKSESSCWSRVNMAKIQV